jgi:hypothetical protein
MGSTGEVGMRKTYVNSTVTAVFLTVALMLSGSCGGGGEEQTSEEEIMRMSGILEDGDLRDPDFGDRLYDGYTFDAAVLDTVSISLTSSDFHAVLSLAEVSTDAELAQWDQEYSSGECLTYVVAAAGEYEARVYSSTEEGGSYDLTIAVVR